MQPPHTPSPGRRNSRSQNLVKIQVQLYKECGILLYVTVKELVEKSGMRRESLCTILGISKAQLDSACTNRRDLKPDVVQKLEGLVQGVSPVVQKAEEPVHMIVQGEDWETGYEPITEAYARSLGYGAAYRESDWFEKARRAIISSRQLGESRGKIAGHERWSK